ncbi:DUF305 domain-containing protein [Synechococcus sp. ATX 2A4]|nr:DUF305 domain-containing protein [Synechococcus sp. ATX 2A4]
MNRHTIAFSHSPVTPLRCIATAGLGAIVLLLGVPALSQSTTPSIAPGYGPGAGMMGQGMMGSRSMDQRFIVMMIPHHDGAIAMADLALTRTTRPEINELAKRIKASQTSENAEMRAFYQQWFGTPVPNRGQGTSLGWHGGMGGAMGMGHMGGPTGMGHMGGGTDLNALRAAPDFDRAFIEQMIPHHQMGVRMASMAQANGQHQQLRTLQQGMVKAQSQEIEQMRQWYRSWYGSL